MRGPMSSCSRSQPRKTATRGLRYFPSLDMSDVAPSEQCMNATLQFLTDETGQKTAVVLPLADYEKLIEDLEDLAVVAERREEPTVSHEQLKAELKRDGLR